MRQGAGAPVALIAVAAALLLSKASAFFVNVRDQRLCKQPPHKENSGRVLRDAFDPDNEGVQEEAARERTKEAQFLLRERRTFISGLVVAVPALCIAPTAALAKDELFRKNPLTNPMLEQIRIWEQAEADELKYGGELQRGDEEKLQSNSYPRLLVPILVISDELQQLAQLIRKPDGSTATPTTLQQAKQILSNPKYDKVSFKKVFNAFGDNIYYTDPDRANVYLGGGATPKSSQSLAYMLRNDILTNVEDMRAEVDFLLKNKSIEDDDSMNDLVEMVSLANRAMSQYLSVVPPSEIEQARALLVAQKEQ